jgi:hypothetical protein
MHKVETRPEAEIVAAAVWFGGEKGRCQRSIFEPEALRDRLDDGDSVGPSVGGGTLVCGHLGRQLSDTFDRLDRLVLPTSKWMRLSHSIRSTPTK